MRKAGVSGEKRDAHRKVLQVGISGYSLVNGVIGQVRQNGWQ